MRIGHPHISEIQIDVLALNIHSFGTIKQHIIHRRFNFLIETSRFQKKERLFKLGIEVLVEVWILIQIENVIFPGN